MALIHWNAKSSFHCKTIPLKTEQLATKDHLHCLSLGGISWCLGPGPVQSSQKSQLLSKPGNSWQLGSGTIPQPELAQRAGFPCSLPGRWRACSSLCSPAKEASCSLVISIKASFTLKKLPRLSGLRVPMVQDDISSGEALLHAGDS